MNNKQLAIILKPICNDQIIMYLIAKQLRTLWFKQKQRELFKVYKKYINIKFTTLKYYKSEDRLLLKNGCYIQKYTWNKKYYSNGNRKYNIYSNNLPLAIMNIRRIEKYDSLTFIKKLKYPSKKVIAMNNKQLAIIFKPICNDQIIIYLIAKQLRTVWFKQKQQELFKIYKNIKKLHIL